LYPGIAHLYRTLTQYCLPKTFALEDIIFSAQNQSRSIRTCAYGV